MLGGGANGFLSKVVNGTAAWEGAALHGDDDGDDAAGDEGAAVEQTTREMALTAKLVAKFPAPSPRIPLSALTRMCDPTASA